MRRAALSLALALAAAPALAAGVISSFCSLAGGPAATWDFTNGVKTATKAGSGTVYVVYGGWNQRTSAAGTVEAAMASAISSLPSNAKCLVLGVPTFDTSSDYYGDTGAEAVTKINYNLLTTYGLYWQTPGVADGSGRLCVYVDMREHFLNAYSAAAAQDIIDFANGVIPSSKRSGATAMTDAEVDAFVSSIISSKGW